MFIKYYKNWILEMPRMFKFSNDMAKEKFGTFSFFLYLFLYFLFYFLFFILFFIYYFTEKYIVDDTKLHEKHILVFVMHSTAGTHTGARHSIPHVTSSLIIPTSISYLTRRLSFSA